MKKMISVLLAVAVSLSAYGVSPTSKVQKKMRKDYFSLAIEGVKHFEGFRANPYRCPAGVVTVGYGFTGHHAKRKVSRQEADLMLIKELHECVLKVQDNVKVPLTRNQLYSLASFTYNCGEGNLRQLVNGKNRLNDGNYKSVETLLPKYRKGGGRVLKGLERRRAWELKMWKGDV